MSCNGCRVLRKGCSEQCVLRQCLRGVVGPQAQANATLFVAKFFGRATLLSFVSAVPEPHRPALFQSLLFEAVGRTINPVGGVVGLLWTGNWQLCQSSVETVLQGGPLQPLPELASRNPCPDSDNCSESGIDYFRPDLTESPKVINPPSKSFDDEDELKFQRCDDLDLSLKSTMPMPVEESEMCPLRSKKRRAETPPEEESKTTASGSGSSSDGGLERRERPLLSLFI
ncbi:LOB domain-containing protein 38-like [Punica granatum]|uniref:LOB domain-containing protein 38-like n=1 Tax=Punica granatum TaxID=22663 RepID=A0A6P8D5R3_PUNGR|nr:LOB domain-containing protein 38-like [Punica granatum]